MLIRSSIPPLPEVDTLLRRANLHRWPFVSLTHPFVILHSLTHTQHKHVICKLSVVEARVADCPSYPRYYSLGLRSRPRGAPGGAAEKDAHIKQTHYIWSHILYVTVMLANRQNVSALKDVHQGRSTCGEMMALVPPAWTVWRADWVWKKKLMNCLIWCLIIKAKSAMSGGTGGCTEREHFHHMFTADYFIF